MMGIASLVGKKNRFKEFLRRRFSLRLHMSLILVATFLSGLLATKLSEVVKYLISNL